MRQRSSKNSRPCENLAFRREYMSRHSYCEMSAWLSSQARDEIPGLQRRETATDPHHLFGGAGRRCDVALNLLAVCRPVHLWSHANLKESRTLGIWLKVRAGLFDPAVFKSVSGMFVAGWLETHRPREPFVRLWDELVKKLS